MWISIYKSEFGVCDKFEFLLESPFNEVSSDFYWKVSSRNFNLKKAKSQVYFKV